MVTFPVDRPPGSAPTCKLNTLQSSDPVKPQSPESDANHKCGSIPAFVFFPQDCLVEILRQCATFLPSLRISWSRLAFCLGRVRVSVFVPQIVRDCWKRSQDTGEGHLVRMGFSCHSSPAPSSSKNIWMWHLPAGSSPHVRTHCLHMPVYTGLSPGPAWLWTLPTGKHLLQGANLLCPKEAQDHGHLGHLTKRGRASAHSEPTSHQLEPCLTSTCQITFTALVKHCICLSIF